MQLRIFHRNFSRTAKDCTRTDKNFFFEIFENWGNSWQSLESLSCPGKDLSPLECQYGYFKFDFKIIIYHSNNLKSLQS